MLIADGSLIQVTFYMHTSLTLLFLNPYVGHLIDPRSGGRR